MIPWQGPEPRRTLLYKFAPGFMSFHGQNSEITLPDCKQFIAVLGSLG